MYLKFITSHLAHFLQILLLESCHKSGELVRITPSLHTACIPEVLTAVHKAESGSAADKPTVNASLEMDVWSYGCILFQVFTGRKLFSGPSSAMIEIIQNSETFRVPPEELGDVIAKYVDFSAAFRGTFFHSMSDTLSKILFAYLLVTASSCATYFCECLVTGVLLSVLSSCASPLLAHRVPRRYCDQLTQLPKGDHWSLSGSQERMGAQEWEIALEVKVDSA